MKILISGITGFCGRAVATALLNRGHTVVGVTRRSVNKEIAGIFPNGIQLIGLNLSDSLSVNKRLPKDIDCIIHTTASLETFYNPGSLGTYKSNTTNLIRNNIITGYNLINFAKENLIFKFINLSTISIYGSIITAVLDESSPITNPTSYGYSKRASELQLAQYENSIGSVSLRLPGVVGKRSSLNWLTHIAQRFSQNKFISIYNPESPFNN